MKIERILTSRCRKNNYSLGQFCYFLYIVSIFQFLPKSSNFTNFFISLHSFLRFRVNFAYFKDFYLPIRPIWTVSCRLGQFWRFCGIFANFENFVLFLTNFDNFVSIRPILTFFVSFWPIWQFCVVFVNFHDFVSFLQILIFLSEFANCDSFVLILQNLCSFCQFWRFYFFFPNLDNFSTTLPILRILCYISQF